MKSLALKRTKWWLLPIMGVFITLIISHLIFSQVNISALETAIRQARYIYVIPAVILLLIGLLMRALRWRALLSNQLSLWRAFNVMNIAYLMNGLLPFRMGEAARAYLITRGKQPIPIFKTVSSIIVERLLDVVAVLILIGLALATGPVPSQVQVAAVVTMILVITAFVVLIILSWQPLRAQQLLTQVFRYLMKIAVWSPRLYKRTSRWLRQFLDGLKPLTTGDYLFQVIGYTTASWILSTCAGFILMFSFYSQASWSTTFLYMATSSLAIAVPAAPGNLGTFELSILFALQATGYADPRNISIAFALFIHGFNLAINIVTGLIGFISEGVFSR